jgi:hypothetical protein
MAQDTKAGRVFEDRVSLPFRYALGTTMTRFFDEFKDKKIMGTKCPSCKKVFVPARYFCSRCFDKMKEWVQVKDTGVVETWTMITYKYSGQDREPPYITAQIRLDGADVKFLHYIGGVDMSDLEKVREFVKTGMKVRAKWRASRNGNIHDIEYFEPA